MDKSATALQQLGQANEMKRRKKQALVWSVFSTILFVIAYIFPIGDALAGRILLTVFALIGLSSIATLVLIQDIKPHVTREQAALLGLSHVDQPSTITESKPLEPAFSSSVSNITPPRTRRLSLTPPKPNLPLTPPQYNAANFTKISASSSTSPSPTPSTSPMPTRFTMSTPSKGYTYNTSPMQEKRVFITTSSSKRRKIEMEDYIKDIDDRCVDALRKCLGQHLQDSVKRFVEIVKTIVDHMVSLQLVPAESTQSMLSTLEYRDMSAKSYLYARSESNVSAQDILTMCKNLQPQSIPQQLHPTARNLLSLITDYESLIHLFSGSTSSTNIASLSPSIVSYGIKRCRELAVDSHLGRVHWPSSSPVKTASVSASAPIPDPALVIAMFFHYADSRSVGGKYQHSFSSMHYVEDFTDSVPPKSSITNIRIARRSTLHYNLYIDAPSTTKLSQCEVCIEEGRQNCFLVIVLFLQTMVQLSDKMRGSVAPIKDLVEDVLGVDAIY